MSMRIVAVALAAAALVSAQTLDRSKAPSSPPIPNYKLPPVYETTLPNGLSVSLVEDARFPLVSLQLVFLAGSKWDPSDMPGLSEAVASLLVEGTKTRTSRQISEEIDEMGASLGGGSGADSLVVSGSALSDSLPRLLALTADISRNATFPQNEVDLHKQNRLQSLMAERAESSFLAGEKMAAVVYGTSPYAHISPTPQSIQKLDPKILASFRDTWLAPNNASLVLIGRLPARAEVMKMITAEFGSWQKKTLPPSPKVDPPAAKRQIFLVDRPGSVQADIHIGRLAPTRTSPDYFPMQVGNAILGGGTDSRMFKNIREKEGFAYDAHSEFDSHRDAGDFEAVTEVRNEVIEEALKAVIAELDRMAKTPVEAGELSNVKNFISGQFLLSLETQGALAAQLSAMKALGLPNDYLDSFTSHIRSVEAGQILSAAKRYVSPDQAAIVVVGDASKIGDLVKKFGAVTVSKAE
jgi:zinc protease